MTGEPNYGPELSALVVVHNEEDDLETCLRHLHFVDEIVVLLDRCTDGSKAIAGRFAHKIIEGAWEFEGERRNTGIDACKGPWIIDADADEWISDSLAAEIRATIENTPYDIFDIPVRNYIGGHYVAHGWGGGSFGKVSYLGLYKTFAKRYGIGRHHAHVEERGIRGPDLKQPLDHYQLNTLLVDPPRAGLDAATVTLASRFDTVLYISCNPQSLADNLKSLSNTHAVTKLAFFDQFPYTPHLESGVILTRRSA